MLLHNADGSVRFHEDAAGPIRIFENPDPFEVYTLGADSSGGNADDPAACIVRARRRPRVVGAIHGMFDPFRFAELVYDLHLFFGRALTAVDPDKFGTEVIALYRAKKALASLYRSSTDPKSPKQKRKDYGYVYTEARRERLDRLLAQDLDRGVLDFNFWPLLEEMRLYGFYGRTNRKGDKVGDHPSTGHDDCQKAYAMAKAADADYPLPARPSEADIRLQDLDAKIAYAAGAQRLMLIRERAYAKMLREAGTAQGHPGTVVPKRWSTTGGSGLN